MGVEHVAQPLHFFQRGCIMASVKDFYKRKLLAAKDQVKWPLVGVIESVTPETAAGKDSDGSTKLVIEFGVDGHRVQLNKTNALSLSAELGDDYETWVGKKIKVTVGDTTFNGQKCKGIVTHKA